MLTEERQDEMVRLVTAGGSVSVQELVDYFQVSEATVRRDLSVLQRDGRLRRVHGGATALPSEEGVYEANMEELEHKYSLHMTEKRRIAQYAASCVTDSDFVYLDAGSTVEQMADFLTGSGASFLTNSLPLAQKLARNGISVHMLPGHVRGTTASVVGSELLQALVQYHFTYGFLVPMVSAWKKVVRRRTQKKLLPRPRPFPSAGGPIYWRMAASSAWLPILHLRLLQACQS